MSKTKKSEPTGWDSLPGRPCDQPYGLPFFRGKNTSVSLGRLGPSFWYEHSYNGMLLIFTFNNARGLIETTQADRHRVPSGFLGPHQFCIIPPNIEMTFDWLSRAELVVLFCESNLFWDREAFPSDLIISDFRSLARRDPCLSHLAQIFLTLCRQSDRPEPEFVEGIGMALASRTLEQYFAPSEASPKARSGLPLATVNQVTSHIDAHLSDVIRAKDLARQVGLSPDHFARRFKISAKVGPKQFALRRRLEKVHELLTTAKYNVTEAGREVGFHDLSHLNRCFRNAFGCSPKEVLKNALAADSSQ